MEEQCAESEREREHETRRDVALARPLAERADGRTGSDGERNQAEERIDAREHRAGTARHADVRDGVSREREAA